MGHARYHRLLDELKPVKIRFAKKLSEPLTIHLDLENLAQLRARAKQKGMPPATLVLLWVLERLQTDQAGLRRAHSRGPPEGRGADGLF